MRSYDLIIVGAGPAGLSCAIAASNRKINYLLIDKGNVVNSIIHFPSNMIFFSTPDQMEIGDLPFNSQGIRPTRVEAVKYYQGLAKHYNIPLRLHTKVIRITRDSDLFCVHMQQKHNHRSVLAKNVILATGYYDNPNYINIPGEQLDHVSHYYQEPFQYFKQRVAIVGGKNSAVEAALDLHRHGAQVTLIHRQPELKESVKYWILPDIINRIKEGSIKAYLNANVQSIDQDHVYLLKNGEIKKLQADAVFILTGYLPDIDILDMCQIEYNKQTLHPKIKRKTLESKITGLYLAGSLIAGRNANKIFIENSRQHGEIILSDIIR